MDVSAEIINILKKVVELHVIIEITENSKSQNIIDVKDLPKNEVFVSPEKLLCTTSYHKLKPYLEGTASTNFLVYKTDGFFSSIKKSRLIYSYINKIKPDILHIEALLIRSWCLLPSFHKFKKVVLSIHDPIAHFGEKDMKLLRLLKSIILNHNKLKGLIFYSDFAKKQFENYDKHNHQSKWVLKMRPYSYFKNFDQKINLETKPHLLFFGRISPYKGIEVLINAIRIVFKTFPHEQLVIAGESVKNYNVPNEILNEFPNNLTVVNRYLTNIELVKLISNAKFVICPYIEATQSGVLMTSFALNKPVIASNVGAFNEYIEEDKNGFLVPPGDDKILAQKIIDLLTDCKYKQMFQATTADPLINEWGMNEQLLLKAYSVDNS